MDPSLVPGGAPAPAPAPAAPEAAPAPAPAPVEPAPQAPAPAPAADPVGAVGPTADSEADEWAAAENEIFPGITSTKPKDLNEQAQPAQGDEAGKTPQSTDPNQKPNEEPGASDDASKQGDGAPEAGDKSKDSGEEDPNAASRLARQSARETARLTEQMRTDVRTKMFASVPEYLQDADGDPIRSIEDVMKLIDPRTVTEENPNGSTFSEEAAAAWLLENQRKFNESKAQINTQIEEIADTMLEVKDQADAVNYKYGEFLKAHTDIRDEVWAEYSKTLITDPESGIIIKAPTSLEWFYDTVMPAKIAAANGTPAPAAAPAPGQAPAPAAPAAPAAPTPQARRADLADRSDIYAPPSNPGQVSAEDAEWAAAEAEVFGDRIK